MIVNFASTSRFKFQLTEGFIISFSEADNKTYLVEQVECLLILCNLIWSQLEPFCHGNKLCREEVVIDLGVGGVQVKNSLGKYKVD